jgi:hypothetical protein
MALFLDIHDRVDGATLEDITAAHLADRRIGLPRGVRFRRYWFSVTTQRLFCLVEASSAEAVQAVHAASHGVLPDEIFEVVEGPKRRRQDLNRLATLVLGLIGAALLASCATSTPSGASPDAAQPSPALQGSAFTSDLYGYSLTLPPGWLAGQAEGSWDPDRPPYSGEPGIDTHYSEDYQERLIAAARPLIDGEDLDAATDALMDQISRAFPPCGEPLAREEVTILGQPARMSTFHCTDGFDVFHATVIHDGQFYTVAYIVPEGATDEARGRFDTMLATLRFSE